MDLWALRFRVLGLKAFRVLSLRVLGLLGVWASGLWSLRVSETYQEDPTKRPEGI